MFLGLGKILRPNKPTLAKTEAYESGVEPTGDMWSQANIRYYVFALFFVMFDVEAVFIFPWAIRLEAYGTFGLIEMAIFIFILLLAFCTPGARESQVGLVESGKIPKPITSLLNMSRKYSMWVYQWASPAARSRWARRLRRLATT